MKRLQHHLIGLDHGEVILFSDYQNDGDMWTGTGPRERRVPVAFSEPFRDAPQVFVSVSLWDVDTSSAMRADLSTDKVSPEGFEIVFRTWGDTRIARIRVAWQATGELPHEEDWDLY